MHLALVTQSLPLPWLPQTARQLLHDTAKSVKADDRPPMNDSHPLLPAPRPPSIFAPASYSPAPAYPPLVAPDFSLPAAGAGAAAADLAPRRWSGQIQAPTSQSRGGYISPDPSPTSDHGHKHDHDPNASDFNIVSHSATSPVQATPAPLSIFTSPPGMGGGGGGGSGGIPISPDTPDAPDGFNGANGPVDAHKHAHTLAHAPPPYLTRPADASGGIENNYFGPGSQSPSQSPPHGHIHGRQVSYTPLDEHHQHQHQHHHQHQHQHQPPHGHGLDALSHNGVMGSMGLSASPTAPAPTPLGLSLSLHRSLSLPYPSAQAHTTPAVHPATTITRALNNAVPAPSPAQAPLPLASPFGVSLGADAGQAVNHSMHPNGPKQHNHGGVEIDPFYYPTMPPHLHSHPHPPSYDYAHHLHQHPHQQQHAHGHHHQGRRSSTASQGPQGRRGSAKKADGKQQTFLPKLFR